MRNIKQWLVAMSHPPTLRAGNNCEEGANQAQRTPYSLVACTLSVCFFLSSALISQEVYAYVDDGTRVFKDLNHDEAMTNAKLTHQRNLQRLAKIKASGQAMPTASTQDVDVDGDGKPDIVVIEDNGLIIVPKKAANLFDIPAGTGIRYVPTTVNGNQYNVTSFTSALDPTFGPTLSQGDDSFVEQPIAFSFPYLGTNYTSVFVGSNGFVTLGVGDVAYSPAASSFLAGPPRIAALMTDLHPEQGGAVHADARTDRIVVTYDGIPTLGGSADSDSNTFQIILYSNGTIEYRYGTVLSPEGSVGISQGNGTQPFNEIDYTTALPFTGTVGAIFEEFNTERPFTSVDDFAVGQEFYKTHPDKFDFLIHFEDFPNNSGGSAHSATINNNTLGIGVAQFDASSGAGSQGELETILYMNNIFLWAGSTANDYINPSLHRFGTALNPQSRLFSGLGPTSSPYGALGFVDITLPNFGTTGYNHLRRALIHENPKTDGRANVGALRYALSSPVSIAWQELTHRWAAFIRFLHPTEGFVPPNHRLLLGRGLAHWSAFFNTVIPDSPFTALDGIPRATDMEGNAIIELKLVNGKIVDKDKPTRIFKDATKKLANTLSACAAQGKSAFLTEPDELYEGGTELEQYLMGIIPAQVVKPFWYVDHATSAIDGRVLDAQVGNDASVPRQTNSDDLAYCGKRVTLTVQDITNMGDILGPVYGPRIPVIGDENDLAANSLDVSLCTGPGNGCADVKTSAWILVVKKGTPPDQGRMNAIKQVNEFRKAWQFYSNYILRNRNADGVIRAPSDPNFMPKFDTSLDPKVH